MGGAALHHLRISVADLTRARAFYEPILSHLGFEDMGAHLDADGRPERLRYAKRGFIFLLGQAGGAAAHDRNAVGLHHIAFAVDSRAAVDRFYEQVLRQMPGVKIEDPPVDCPEYGAGYYATFFYDPDGIKLEVAFTP